MPGHLSSRPLCPPLGYASTSTERYIPRDLCRDAADDLSTCASRRQPPWHGGATRRRGNLVRVARESERLWFRTDIHWQFLNRA